MERQRVLTRRRRAPILPQAVIAARDAVLGWAGRQTRRAAGLAIALGGVAMLAALASYDPGDPSLNSAGPGPTTNWLAMPGAIFADLGLQTLGLGAAALALPVLAWGWFVFQGRAVRALLWKLALWPILALGVAAVAAGVPAPEGWPLPSGLGGVLGSAIESALRAPLLEILDPAAAAASLAALLFLIALTLLAFLAGAPLGIAGAAMAALGLTAFSLAAMPVRRLMARTARPDDLDGEDEAMPAPRARVISAADRLAPAGDPAGRRVERSRAARPSAKSRARDAQGRLDLRTPDDFELPPLGLLTPPPERLADEALSDEALEENARMLEGVLQDFGVRGQIVKVRPGPVVTLYELEPAAGVKSARVINLADDIARSMSAVAARVATIPGRNVIGIELPNARRERVVLREMLSAPVFTKANFHLPLALGKTIGGEPVVVDLAKMPHLLVAGTTGSGKSVAINAMILSLLYRLPPERCRLVMIDPKMLELSVYDDIPHLLTPVVTEPKKAVVALKWTVREMEDRYRKMSKLGVRNIEGFNARVQKARRTGERLTRTVQTGYDPESDRPVYEEEELSAETMPYIVVVIDEMADLMLVAGKEIEAAVQRLAQMARAAGIHLIAATQRPSVDVITGTIKANFPARISFQVTSKIDSRTILGEQGAEQLLGQGDMLSMGAGGRIQRVHGPFVSEDEVEAVVAFLKKQGAPDYRDEITEEPDDPDVATLLGGGAGGGSGDALYDQAVAIVLRERRVSTSYIQRRLTIGYNRAARIIEQMEEDGVISAPNHQGKREVLPPGEDS